MKLTADNIYEPPEENEGESKQTAEQISSLIAKINSRYQVAKTSRLPHEERWMEAYNNFRGIYGKRQAFRKNEKSRVFVKVTKTKVLAGYGHLVDIVLGNDKFPIKVDPTPIPEGVDEYAYVAPQQAPAKEETPELDLPFNVGHKGDGKVLPPGTTFGSKLRSLFSSTPDKKKEVLQPGINPNPGGETFSPAKLAAEKMDKLIQDQLAESNSVQELSKAMFECVLLGTGIIKGPFSYHKTKHIWSKDENGKRVYSSATTKIPKLEFVSIWDAYPDPNATCREEMSYFIHRHRLNESQLRALGNNSTFDKQAIAKCIIAGPNYTKEGYEHVIKSSEEHGSGADNSDRYEVLEYWGVVGAEEAKEQGLKIGSDALAEVQINVWVCNGNVIRIVSNPFKPNRIPYHMFNYEINPYSIFGVGIPENMTDSQQIMNGHARMAIDNLALAGGLVFDIDETALVPGQDLEIYNGKVFYRQAGQPGQAVFGIKFPNTAQENLMMFDRFRQISDEETGIPSYSHGQTGVTGMTRTASGMSMLLGAASLNIKTVIKNIDFQLLEPLGRDFYQWNMQFFEGDIDVENIDLEVKALGTRSLMQKEVRSQRLTQFLQVVMNPALAPFVKLPYIVEELADSLDLDKTKTLNTMEEARLMAEIIGLQNATAAGPQIGAPGQPPGVMGAPSGVPPTGAELGPTGTGNGNIGTGVIPQPGEDEFSQ